MKAVMSPSLYLIVVPLMRRNAQPMFNRRSFCSTFTLHPRMAAYTRSSTHAQGTVGTCVRSTGRGTLLISSGPLASSVPVAGSSDGITGVLLRLALRVFSGIELIQREYPQALFFELLAANPNALAADSHEHRRTRLHRETLEYRRLV